ncbi:MAG: 2OG-Fe(II) oxygenase [Gammaproteobacteria bacterium]|nr:2OG-Fe(II) oxygenase [Gammaproteobacteria bacterium]
MFEFLDLKRYPLDQPNTQAWHDLVAQSKTALARDGMFNLEGLLDPNIAEQTAADLAPLFREQSFVHQREHNIYFSQSLPGLPDDHPALMRFNTSNNTLCADQLRGTPMDLLYRWPPFATFLAATMDKTHLHIMADPLAALNAMSYHEGQLLNWHFDRSEFTTTMLLQAPEQGGEFVYRTDLRTENDPNYDGVAKLLKGEDPKVRNLTLSPGTLNVFRGKNTPHKVAAVKGERCRVIAVFSFFEKPGVMFSDEERIGFYGRAA